MKILVVNNFYYPYEVGGAEESLRLQCEALIKLGQKVDVLTVAHELSGNPTRVNGVSTHYLRTLFSSGSPLHARRSSLMRIGWQFGGFLQVGAALHTFRLLYREKYDVVYVNNLPGIGRASVLLAKVLGIPVVAGLRDYAWICLRQSRFQRGKNCTGTCVKCRLGCSLRRSIAGCASGIAANSTALLDTFKASRTFTDATSRVIYAGAGQPEDQGKSHPSPRHTNPWLSIGVMGQIQPSKGFELFLQEVSPLLAAGGIRILIAGTVSGEHAISLRERFAGDDVTFVGRVDRAEFFRRVDVVVIPSLWNEPLSRITYEALAYGKCVVVSSHGGQKEIIRSGTNGYVYTPGNGSLVTIIRLLQEQPELIDQQEHGAASSAAEYTPASAASSLLALFESVTAIP
ncbi:glycosyltransferase [Stenotrophomonas terrae]|uniref:glycosyltransferase n=1 Tax=Stenotrophomonas terrae TaxID=405446 RepID=UPI003208A201